MADQSPELPQKVLGNWRHRLMKHDTNLVGSTVHQTCTNAHIQNLAHMQELIDTFCRPKHIQIFNNVCPQSTPERAPKLLQYIQLNCRNLHDHITSNCTI